MCSSVDIKNDKKTPTPNMFLLYCISKEFVFCVEVMAIIRVLHNFTSHYFMLWSMKYDYSFCKLFQEKLLFYPIPKIHCRNGSDYKYWSTMGCVKNRKAFEIWQINYLNCFGNSRNAA